MILPPIPIPDPAAPIEGPKVVPVESIEAANRERQNKPFFEVLEVPWNAECSHQRRGVTLDPKTRTVYCKCGAVLDPFDALMIYAKAERRLVSTRDDIEHHKQEEARKVREAEERKPFLRQVNGFCAVYNPKPPQGDGAIVAYNVTLHPCGHTVRWPTRGRRNPGRNLTCDICRRSHRAKQTGTLVSGTAAKR